MKVREALSLTLENSLNHVQSRDRKEEAVNNTENWPDLASIIGDSFNMSQPLLFLPVPTLEAVKAKTTSLSFCPAANKNQTAQVSNLTLCLPTCVILSESLKSLALCLFICKIYLLHWVVLRIKWINMLDPKNTSWQIAYCKCDQESNWSRSRVTHMHPAWGGSEETWFVAPQTQTILLKEALSAGLPKTLEIH